MIMSRELYFHNYNIVHLIQQGFFTFIRFAIFPHFSIHFQLLKLLARSCKIVHIFDTLWKSKSFHTVMANKNCKFLRSIFTAEFKILIRAKNLDGYNPESTGIYIE